MTTIDLSISSDRRQRALQRVREREIVIPTLPQMKNPELIPAEIKARLHNVGLWELNPLNLFRITWKNEPLASGGDFGGVYYLELPKSLTGVEARIIVMVGKWFPTGAHKVGAAFGCLVPRLVTGQFDPPHKRLSGHLHVLIVDDHNMVRKGMKILLEQFPGIKGVGKAANGLQAIEYVSRLQPDIVLMDLVMPVMDGIEAIQRIVAVHPDQHIIVLTASSDGESFVQAIQAGAQGYLVKDLDPEELVRAIRNVDQGRPEFDTRFVREVIRRARSEDFSSPLPGQLSEKEVEILRMLTHGMTDQEIARELVVTEVTVKTHISRILRKLHLENRVQAVLYSLRSGLVSEGEIAQMTFNPYEPG